MKWTETDLAYFAAIIDGEGCISLRKEWSGRYVLRVHFSHTSFELIEWMLERFPSKFWPKKSYKNWRPRFDWLLQTSVHDALFPRILPYMVVKRKHIELAMEFRKTIMKRSTGSYKMTSNLIAIREAFIIQFRVLNKRGIQILPPCCPSA